MPFDSYTNPDAEALLVAGDERRARSQRDHRELATSLIGALCFLIAASLLAALAPWKLALSPLNLALVAVVWVVSDRVQFPVAGGWTHPTMLAFVPALFLLPTPLVPLVGLFAIFASRFPAVIRRRTPVSLVPAHINDTLFTIGPVLVIVLGNAQRFAWSHWPIYVSALLAYFAFDMAFNTSWSWLGEGISPRVQLPLLAWVYVVDLALAPLGLLIAAAAVNRPALVLLALSPMGLAWLFARERRQRMDETLALSTAYRGTALLLADVVEADDHYTGTHSRQVVDLAVAVGERLSLDSTQRRNVEFAALLHDVGKIHIPKDIINKPGPLNDEEWAVVRKHTIDGERMLNQVGGLLADVGAIVRASHERWDGTGYPDHLAGEAIPIEARTVATCDAFSAMTTDRAYRRAMSTEQALAELRHCAGTQFDPTVVAEIEKFFGVPAAAPAEPKLQPWQVMGQPRVAA